MLRPSQHQCTSCGSCSHDFAQCSAAQSPDDTCPESQSCSQAKLATQPPLSDSQSKGHTSACTPAQQDAPVMRQTANKAPTSACHKPAEHAQQQQQQGEPPLHVFGDGNNGDAGSPQKTVGNNPCLDCPGLEIEHHWQALVERGNDGDAGHIDHTGQHGGASGQDWAAGQEGNTGQEQDAGHLTAAADTLMSGRLPVTGPQGDASEPSSPIYGVACSTAFSSPARQGTSRGAGSPLQHQISLCGMHCDQSPVTQLLQHLQGLLSSSCVDSPLP